jgi:hypothetical protein
VSDKELLEMAAKAAGMSGQYPFEGDTVTWNPLTDDGDALRLAVKLDMGIEVLLSVGETRAGDGHCETIVCEQHGSDPCAATRRAIVRAAAEIGRADKTD